MKQSLIIPNWHPAQAINGPKGLHWSAAKARHESEAQIAYVAARLAKWVFLEGRVQLNVTFVYPRHYKPDQDNLTARLKGVIDGLKMHFFTDDSMDFLYIHMNLPRIERGVKQLELELETI